MYGPPSGPFATRMVTEGWGPGGLNENVGSKPLALGVWHRLEMLMNSPAGALQWWVDGVLVGSYTGLSYPSGGFLSLEFSPTWGGVGDTKTEDDYFWFDHIQASPRETARITRARVGGAALLARCGSMAGRPTSLEPAA